MRSLIYIVCCVLTIYIEGPRDEERRVHIDDPAGYEPGRTHGAQRAVLNAGVNTKVMLNVLSRIFSINQNQRNIWAGVSTDIDVNKNVSEVAGILITRLENIRTESNAIDITLMISCINQYILPQ